ncbi:tRNA-modifying protein YgfZ [Candidatus Pantoea edessiphila]|uniref:tRNA-modifying protein YgfZ n=1 Tax=Candidatus Pantoea edessiphila TaxID=2044610 RepID=A0A2P5SXP1_9GAMM|nr:tRNA-modifying protein YgfZ [Candidatus Pantoea edessiphila]MBK4775699.1 tRNA-modifying protein YgfZ [Pantoea sp. Edef]PPI87070.1 tRNA-modifying protein YgfZ [Candidatus Pantoea edessiphila]
MRQPVESSSRLPLTLMFLDDWALVSVYGLDAIKYLQTQLTLDITQIKKNQHYLTAHCNSSGKMWSNLRIFYFINNIAYIIRKEIIEIQLNEIKKYSLFSKVDFVYDNQFLLGLSGMQAKQTLENLFTIVPNINTPVVQYNTTTAILWFENPIERFLIVTNKTTGNILQNKLLNKASFANSDQWLALDIEAGIPVINIQSTGKFIPQATNLHMLGAISFGKGCYIGQEVIARAKYLGINKNRLYWLAGKSNCLPEISDSLEIKTTKYWKVIGKILASVKLDNNTIWVQAVMNKEISPNSILRIKHDENSCLMIQPIHYYI